MASIDDQLRAAIERDPRSRYAISKVSGIDQAVISRMMHGARVNTATADALAAALDMEIVLKRKSRKVANRGKRRQ